MQQTNHSKQWSANHRIFTQLTTAGVRHGADKQTTGDGTAIAERDGAP